MTTHHQRAAFACIFNFEKLWWETTVHKSQFFYTKRLSTIEESVAAKKFLVDELTKPSRKYLDVEEVRRYKRLTLNNF